MDELLQKLTTANQVFQEANKYDIRRGEFAQQINAVNNQISNARIKWIIIGAVGVVIGGMIGMLVGLVIREILKIIPFLEMFASRLGPLGFFAAGAVVVFICYTLFKKEKGKYDAQIAELQRKMKAEEDAGSRYLCEHLQEYNFIPTDYWYPLAINYLYDVVKSGRATTLPEAMDRYEEQMHRWKVEGTNQQILAQQQEMIERIAYIEGQIRW